MAHYLCFSDAMAAIRRHDEVVSFCSAKAAAASVHNQRSYWLANVALNAGWRESALADLIGWASIHPTGE